MSNLQTISALFLLMFGIFRANNHDFSVTLDNFALVTHGFNRRSNFHTLLQLVLVSPNDATFGQIVRADLHFYRIAFDDLDALDAHLSRRVGDDLRAALLKLHSVGLIGQHFYNLSLNLYYVFL